VVLNNIVAMLPPAQNVINNVFSNTGRTAGLGFDIMILLELESIKSYVNWWCTKEPINQKLLRVFSSTIFLTVACLTIVQVVLVGRIEAGESAILPQISNVHNLIEEGLTGLQFLYALCASIIVLRNISKN
jgi:hypothetical protein